MNRFILSVFCTVLLYVHSSAQDTIEPPAPQHSEDVSADDSKREAEMNRSLKADDAPPPSDATTALPVESMDPIFRVLEDARKKGSYNPAPMILAANALHALGKERALEVLTDYLNHFSSPVNPNASPNHVFVILRILFEPIELGESIPSPRITEATIWHKQLLADWPLNPVELVEGIPFKYEDFAAGTGIPEHPIQHVEFVKENCVMRDSRLVPPANPIEVADRLCNSFKVKQLDALDEDFNSSWIRRQAVIMLPEQLRPEVKYWNKKNDKEWRKLLQTMQEVELEWNDSLGYVLK